MTRNAASAQLGVIDPSCDLPPARDISTSTTPLRDQLTSPDAQLTQAVVRVQLAVMTIARQHKHKKGWEYLNVEVLIAALKPVLLENGLTMGPEAVEVLGVTALERSEAGNVQYRTDVLVTCPIRHVAGGVRQVQAFGQAVDNAAQGASKATTDAMKTAFRWQFLVSQVSADGKTETAKPKVEKKRPEPLPMQWTPEQEAAFTKAVSALGMEPKIAFDLAKWHPGSESDEWRRGFYTWLRSDAGRSDYNALAVKRKAPPVQLGQTELIPPKQGAQTPAAPITGGSDGRP